MRTLPGGLRLHNRRQAPLGEARVARPCTPSSSSNSRTSVTTSMVERSTFTTIRAMEALSLVVDLVLAVALAFLGGIVAQRLGQPVILGSLLAGVLIGPFTPGPVADVHQVQVLAEIGVAFLMFA